jgi:hydrogenase maturation protease
MTSIPPRIVVIGLGNILMEDEGVGVRVVELLESRYLLPPHVEVIDGGTTGTELLEPMRNADYLIVADAVNTGAPLGSLVRLTGAAIPAFFQCKISNHQLGLSDLLAVLTVTQQAPKHVTIIGMVPYALNNTLGLSPATLARLEEMLDMLLAELQQIGITPQLRPQALPGFWAEQTRTEVNVCA